MSLSALVVSLALAGPAAEPASSIDRGPLRRVIAGQGARLRRCYERGLARDPALAGELVISFAIDARGAVPWAELRSSTLGDPAVEDCVVEVFRGLRFVATPPLGGGHIVVHYPLVFARE